MRQYIGTKRINAEPMTRAAYNLFRGWELPKDENGDDAGYLVEYIDGGAANTATYKGYVSWSPKDVFERAYNPVDGMTFGMALEALKAGERVARAGWNGKGMWLCMIQRGSWHVEPLVNKAMMAHSLDALPWIGMKTVDGGFVPWLASQTDMLADDWAVVF